MKIVHSRWIPFRGFSAINLFGVIVVRKDLPEEYLSDPLWLETIVRHERIHTRQMVELLVIPFYLIYIIEWLVRLAICRDAERAYRSISFEQEAYAHQDDPEYRQRRKPYAFLRYWRF
ncbi:hypothetical protein [uncultured Porphyromonas sp.]|uniref:hypothetical protein n=1 Tax=uncultured Porphyromonas sp. TaxID=159274 RepID=UPI002634B221|nr:hypothetical protein [uncultured Porphyromonas sp.]